MWVQGMYFMSALQTSLSHALSKRSNAKYAEKPLLEDHQNNKNPEDLTEEEKERMRQQFLSKLMIMQANFNMNHDEQSEQ